MKKKQLFDYINIMEEAIEALAEGASKEDFLAVLVECQQCAIDIGNDIEQRGESSRNIVVQLEVFFEALFTLSEHVDEENIVESSLKYLLKLLNDIRYGIKYELVPDAKVMVFLPFKVSMWDSMESIWLAARDNPDVEPHVIPIPYYDRESSGKLVKMNYEGDNYPDYVPVESWQACSMEMLKPDIIFIHNAYDQYNYVTCVHPSFFTEELKKHTNRLVYVPYFYTNKLYSESHLQLPGYIHCDDIIVQNEMVRKQFAKTVFEDKVVSLGSPKLDCILNYKAELRYPKELESYIGNKKIVLLNTSISTFLKDSDFAIEKTLSVIRTLSRYNELLVVWRPHPLLEATMQSMRPEQYHNFIECNKMVSEIDNCIIDTKMNLDELIAISDAYIGEEESSIVVLFASLGKPIFILDSARVFENEFNEFIFDFVREGNDIYFGLGDFSAIARANANTGVIEEIFPIDSDQYFDFRYYTGVSKQDNKLYFVPFNQNKIAVFDLVTQKMGSTEVKHSSYPNYNNVLSDGKSLWFIPTTNDSLLKVDVEHNTTNYYSKPTKVLKKSAIENGYYSMFGSCKAGTNIYISSPTSNVVSIFDTISEKTSTKVIGSENSGFWHMVYDGIDIWLIPYKGRSLVRWNLDTDSIVELKNYPEGFSDLENEMGYFIQLVDCEEYILVFPKCANMIIKIDKKTEKISEWKIDLGFTEGQRKSSNYNWGSNYYFVKRINDKLYTMTAYDNALLEISLIDKKVNRLYISIPEELRKRYYSEVFKIKKTDELQDYYLRENGARTLSLFGKMLIDNEIGVNKEEQTILLKTMVNSDGTAGKKIMDYVVKEF